MIRIICIDLIFNYLKSNANKHLIYCDDSIFSNIKESIKEYVPIRYKNVVGVILYFANLFLEKFQCKERDNFDVIDLKEY